MRDSGWRSPIGSTARAGALLLVAVLRLWAQAWALPTEPIEPKEHSGPITPSPTNLTTGALAESQVVVDFKCGGNADGHEAWRRVGTTGTFARVAGATGCPGTTGIFRDRTVLVITGCGLFPALQEVVIAGHSAGGQFTQRYAATSRIEYSRPTLRFRYVVANPSSYMYLNDRRPTASGAFIVPTGCSGYNDYKYGLEDRNAYASDVSDAEILAQYPAREATYLLGGNDTDVNDDTLEKNCQANLQGPQRLARGTFYHQHMLLFFPENYHRRVVVPGVGHNAWGMYGSLQGMLALFF